MKNELLKKYDWKDIPFLAGSAQLEMNLIQDVPKLLMTIMPDYNFGLFTPDDMDHRRALGWEPLDPKRLGDDWKESAPLGFVMQFSDHGGYLTLKGKILCYMPIEVRRAVHKKIMDGAEARYKGAALGIRKEAQGKVSDGGATVDESNLELEKQLPGKGPVNDMEPQKKRGRPPKNG